MESAVCRSPHGERGLKYLFMLHKRRYNMSLPVCGAWIEIINEGLEDEISVVAPRVWSVD